MKTIAVITILIFVILMCWGIYGTMADRHESRSGGNALKFDEHYIYLGAYLDKCEVDEKSRWVAIIVLNELTHNPQADTKRVDEMRERINEKFGIVN